MKVDRATRRRIGRSAALLAGVCVVLGSVPGAVGADGQPSWTPLCSRNAAPAGAERGSMLGAAAQALAAWIAESRDAALRAGVEPVPAPIRAQLEGFVPSAVLDLARWRVGGGSEAALQGYLASLGLVAVTFDDVVVFSERATALANAGLWAHELRHVMQYADCGVPGFALEYLYDYDGLETDAADYARRWHQWRVDGWLRGVTGEG